jgi:dTDP-4-dehydrorhamnose 3,5-epimerase
MGEFMEEKVVICIEGSVSDVIVDIRRSSATFMKYKQFELSAKKKNALRIPSGFAHGFQTLRDNTVLMYLHSKEYSPDYEAGLNANDPSLGINWPLQISSISERDLNFSYIQRK